MHRRKVSVHSWTGHIHSMRKLTSTSLFGANAIILQIMRNRQVAGSRAPQTLRTRAPKQVLCRSMMLESSTQRSLIIWSSRKSCFEATHAGYGDCQRTHLLMMPHQVTLQLTAAHVSNHRPPPCKYRTPVLLRSLNYCPYANSSRDYNSTAAKTNVKRWRETVRIKKTLIIIQRDANFMKSLHKTRKN